MRRILLFAVMIAVALMGTSCAPKEAAPTEATGAAASSPFAANYEGALPALSQVMVGTFKLEETLHAVTSEQAQELLPLWRAYRSMAQSDSASRVELDALLDQIVETMTDEQIEAIGDMQLTREDLVAVMQAQGIQMGGAGGRGDMSPEQIQQMQTRVAQRQASGGGAPGGPGGGGGFGGQRPGGGQAPNPEQIATLRAQRGGGGGTLMTQGPLFDALVKLLQNK